MEVISAVRSQPAVGVGSAMERRPPLLAAGSTTERRAERLRSLTERRSLRALEESSRVLAKNPIHYANAPSRPSRQHRRRITQTPEAGELPPATNSLDPCIDQGGRQRRHKHAASLMQAGIWGSQDGIRAVQLPRLASCSSFFRKDLDQQSHADKDLPVRHMSLDAGILRPGTQESKSLTRQPAIDLGQNIDPEDKAPAAHTSVHRIPSRDLGVKVERGKGTDNTYPDQTLNVGWKDATFKLKEWCPRPVSVRPVTSLLLERDVKYHSSCERQSKPAHTVVRRRSKDKLHGWVRLDELPMWRSEDNSYSPTHLNEDYLRKCGIQPGIVKISPSTIHRNHPSLPLCASNNNSNNNPSGLFHSASTDTQSSLPTALSAARNKRGPLCIGVLDAYHSKSKLAIRSQQLYATNTPWRKNLDEN